MTSPSLRSTRQIGGRRFDQSCGCARITSQRTSVLLRDSWRLGLFWWNLGIIFNIFQPHLGSLSPRMNGAESTKQPLIFPAEDDLFCQDRIPGSLAILAGDAEFTTETAQVCWDTAMVLVVRLARALAPLHCAPQTALWETCVTLDLP